MAYVMLLHENDAPLHLAARASPARLTLIDGQRAGIQL